MLKFRGKFLVRPEVPGLGPEVPGVAGSSGGRGKSLGTLGKLSVQPGSSGGRKFRGSPEVPGVVEFLPGRTLNSRSENGGGKLDFHGQNWIDIATQFGMQAGKPFLLFLHEFDEGHEGGNKIYLWYNVQQSLQYVLSVVTRMSYIYMYGFLGLAIALY